MAKIKIFDEFIIDAGVIGSAFALELTRLGQILCALLIRLTDMQYL